MSFTNNWNIEKPIEGALDWNISLNNNFDLIDSILQSIRTNYSETTKSTGPDFHNEVGTLWYSMLDNPGEGLFIRKTEGLYQLLDQAFADGRYLMKQGDTYNGTLQFGSNAMLYFFNAITQDFARMLFQTYGQHQSLTVEFGGDSSSSVRFLGNSNTDIFHMYQDHTKSFVPLEVPSATDNLHAINKGQADSTYATALALQAALDRISALENLLAG